MSHTRKDYIEFIELQAKYDNELDKWQTFMDYWMQIIERTYRAGHGSTTLQYSWPSCCNLKFHYDNISWEDDGDYPSLSSNIRVDDLFNETWIKTKLRQVTLLDSIENNKQKKAEEEEYQAFLKLKEKYEKT